MLVDTLLAMSDKTLCWPCAWLCYSNRSDFGTTSGNALLVNKAGKLIGIESVNRAADHVLGRKILPTGGTITPEQAADLSVDLKKAAA